MPAWWGKRSGRTKSDSDKSGKASISSKNESIRRKEGNIFNNKAKSFEDDFSTRNSPRRSRDDLAHPTHVGMNNNNLSSGFSGFDSASSLEKAHPLPRPLDDHQVQGHGSGSGSVSSVGSSSSDEHSHGGVVDQAVFSGHVENRSSPLLRSPAPSTRVSTSTPFHTRVNGGGSTLDSPSSKPDDRKCESHPLPLPPSSPTALLTPRSPNTSESSCSSTCSKWRKGRLLGRGTFGHVYLGFNSENGQMCAIKEVKVVSDDRSSKESLRQLNQEIALLSQLSHANIVQYYGSDLNDERLSVYLEYVSGGSIHKLLQEYGPFEEPVIQNYTRQILLGLAYLHGRNTAHRDIKGANILVDPNGEIKLADFGMAKHIASCSSMLSFKGSPYWMAPEVVMNANGYSLPVDIWSLGCTVLEMATSKPPWSQYEGVAAIFKIGNSKDTPEIPDHLSPEAKNFIHLCLQREPSSRPTAIQLLSHPFVRNQTTLRAANVNITREAFPCAFDGSRTPTASEMLSSRTNNGSFDIARTLTSPRDNPRTITSSLPVSPSSSPLRQADGALYRNFFLSPPHPSYTNSSIGQSSHNYSDYPAFQLRPGPRISLGLERPQFRAQAHVKSPTRMM